MWRTVSSQRRFTGFTVVLVLIFTACQTAAPTSLIRPQGFGGSDPLYAIQKRNYDLMKLEQAWAITQGSREVRIAVIDNGVADHPDLSAQWTPGDPDGGVNLGATNTGEVYDPRPSFFEYSYFHGTHVAGIIAAAQGNGQGGIGVCPGCRLVPIRYVIGLAGISPQDLASAVRYAAGYSITITNPIPGASPLAPPFTVTIPGSAPRVKIINLSLSAKGPCDSGLSQALQAAYERGVVVVASAGNLNNSSADGVAPGSIQQASAMTPANCPHVISVAAAALTTPMPRVSNFSNVGATLLAPGGNDIADAGSVSTTNYFGAFVGCTGDGNPLAVGTDRQDGILSTYLAYSSAENRPKPCYRYLHGTSMSAPMVSGVIGLLLSREPNLTPDQVAQRLTSTATPVSGGLLVDAEAVLLNRVPPTSTPASAPCDDPAGAACTFDARSLGQLPDGSFVESIASYGKIWNFDVAGNPSAGNGTEIQSVARYASGPCASVPAGQRCTFDTRTLAHYPGVGFVESITAYGKYWNFDANQQPWGGNGGDLRSVTRFASGPCAYAPPTLPCKFDTRALADYPGVGFLETITAYGRFWNFDLNGREWVGGGNGSSLMSVSRYATGPCASTPTGQPCTFDTLTNVMYPGVGYVQSITAYGKGYNFDLNGNPLAGNGMDLKSVPRFAAATKSTPAKTYITLRRIVDPCAPDLSDQACEITRNYTEVLARRPEPAGLQHWINTGLRGASLRSYFANSAEATNLIQTLSRACLRRDADQGLLEPWRDYLTRGGSMVSVAGFFADATETHQKGDLCVMSFPLE